MSDPPASYPKDVREAFEYCAECELVVVSVDRHVCSNNRASGHPSTAERERFAAVDDRPLDEQVLYPKGRSQNNAWAYHELGTDGDPLHHVSHQSGSTTGTREEAITNGCYPCGRCRLIQDEAEES